MSNRKISNLPAVIGANIQDTDILPLVASGVTSSATVANLRIKLGFNVPAGGRTVTDPATYLLNNAVANVKDFGAVGNGVVNDTAAITAAFLGGLHVVFPEGTYAVDPTGFDVRSGQTVEFLGGATIKLVAHNSSNYQIIRIWDVSNVRLISPSVDGSRALNLAVGGESGMGLSIKGSTNVSISDLRTTGCWGDGVYIAGSGTGGQAFCQNVVFNRLRDFNSRRNGMSIISGKQITVNDALWDTIDGTSPFRGLDIEPNSNSDFLEDIEINNPTTLNCAGIGIGFSPKLLAGGTAKTVSVTINNHYDKGSVNGGGTSSFDSSLGSVSGVVKWVDPVWVDSGGQGFRSRNYDSAGPLLHLVRPTVRNCNRLASGQAENSSPFEIDRPAGDPGGYDIGNVVIEGAIVDITETTILEVFDARIYTGGGQVTKFRFINPLYISASAQLFSRLLGTGTVTDQNRAYKVSLGGSGTIGTGNYAGTILSKAGGTSTYTIATTMALGNADLVFENQGTATFNVKPPAGGNFIGQIADKFLASNISGAYVRIRPLSATTFLVVEMVGDWTWN